VTFTPTAAEVANGVLTLTTDDPDTPILTVNLTGLGLNAGNVAVNPVDVYQALLPGGNATQTVTISNNGLGDLNFTIPAPDMYNKYVEQLGEVAPVETVELPKGVKDDDFGVTPLGSGGPDIYGYKWIDSDEPGGPEFKWADITETGTVALADGDDSNVGPFPIGFPFEFYGTTFTEFRVCTNGFISFDNTSTSYSNSTLPSTSAPSNLIAPFWDDLNLNATGSGDVYYETVDGNLVVLFDSVMPYNGGTSGAGPFTFQVILEPSGRITMQYLTLNSAPASCTVGIQDATGTVGLEMAYNTAYLHDNLAILVRTPLNWMTVGTTSGTVLPGASMDIDVMFDATDLEVGLHTGVLTVVSDDPITPALDVPVTLEVTDVSAVGDEVLPRVTALNQNVPNPFNPMTTIRFSLPRTGQVELAVYDVRGARVRNLVSGQVAAGNHTRVWFGQNDDGHPVPSGVYFYRLHTTDEVITKRMTLVK
jgi:hypothetical protein